MKYRHQYHAGNFADVHKHVLLLEVLRRSRARTRASCSWIRTRAAANTTCTPEMPRIRPNGRREPRSCSRRRRATRRCGAIANASRSACTAPRCAIAVRRCSPPDALRPDDRAVFFETQREESSHLRKLLPGIRAARGNRGWIRGTARAAAAAGAARLRAHRSALRAARGLSRACSRRCATRCGASRARCCCCGCRSRCAATSTSGSRACARRSRSRCSRRCCGCTRRIRAPDSTAPRWRS